jgi:hypothetical protein
VNHVLDRIADERTAQDAKWGGPSHDDDHAADEWVGFIQDYLNKADSLIGSASDLPEPDDVFCRRMVQIAALAVACVQSFDRHHRREVPAETDAEAALRAERAEVKRLRGGLAALVEFVNEHAGEACLDLDIVPRIEALCGGATVEIGEGGEES